MAGIQDPLTDLPPPSRLDFEELSNFHFDSSPVSPLRPPALFLPASPGDGDNLLPLRPRLLFIASSPSALHILLNLPGKQPIGSVVLPASSTSQDDKEKNPKSFSDDGMLMIWSAYDGRVPKKEVTHVCPVYSLDDEQQASVVMVAVPNPVSEERASSWARALLAAIVPEQVLMLAAVQRDNFRGKLSADDQIVFRLETDRLRSEEQGRVYCALPYFPSGSIVSGLPAAVLSRCQLLGLKGRLLLSWPEAGPSAPSFISSVLRRLAEASSLDFSPSLQVPFKGKSVSDLDIYF